MLRGSLVQGCVEEPHTPLIISKHPDGAGVQIKRIIQNSQAVDSCSYAQPSVYFDACNGACQTAECPNLLASRLSKYCLVKSYLKDTLTRCTYFKVSH